LFFAKFYTSLHLFTPHFIRMEGQLQDQFIRRLEEKYGSWDRTTSRFGSASFGSIAKDLCISASQFSKLLYGSATEGMYTRSMRNIDRLIEFEQEQKARLQAENQLKALQPAARKAGKYRTLWLGFASLSFFLIAYLLYHFLLSNHQASATLDTEEYTIDHPLKPFFDRPFDAAFDSPFLNESEVHDYCPCAAYEGDWALEAPYKLPLPGNKKPGVYYTAKSADVRMKCSKSDTLNAGKGGVLVAYEYLINEIWVDTTLTPLSPQYFDKETKQFTTAFDTLSFEQHPQFQKVATIHSFFIDKFEIYKDSITRKGEPCGRFATDINNQLVETFELDLKNILEDVLGDLNKTDCSPSENPYCDPNDLKENESVLLFDCMYTIDSENLGIGGGYPYSKGFRLVRQNYSDNLLCHCE